MTTHLALARLRAELERRYGPRLVRVLLFGSRARGEARADSDWDVAVVLKDYDGGLDELHRLADLSYDLMLETGAVLSLKPFSPEELERETLLTENIRHEAIAV